MSPGQPPEAEYPEWWVQNGLVGEQPPSSANTSAYNAWAQQNYAPANLGQLKNFAWAARGYLDEQLAAIGGAGPDIASLVDGFDTNPAVNYAPANLGQFKVVVQPFYDRLAQVGYDTRPNC